MAFVQNTADNSILLAPSGSNLDNSNRTLSPLDGSIAFNITDGTLYYGKNSAWNVIAAGSQGPQGPQGPQGIQGPQGPQGVPGQSYQPVPPTLSKVIYVAKFGNDTIGDGSFATPFASLAKAVLIANTLASSVNPIFISISAGIYVENNSSMPITITASGISIGGDSSLGVFISPSSTSTPLISTGVTTKINDLTLQSSSPLGVGLVLSAGNLSSFSNLRINGFLTAISCGGSSSSYSFDKCAFALNSTALQINNCLVECNDTVILGRTLITDTPTNTGITISGSSASLVFTGGLLGLCQNGVLVENNALTTLTGTILRRNNFDIQQSTSSELSILSCDFQLSSGPSDIAIQVSGAGSVTKIIGCNFNGKDINGVTSGTCLKVINSAKVTIAGGNLESFTTGITIGEVSSTSSTILSATSLYINDCINDVVQLGSSTLILSSCTASKTKIAVSNSTNVSLAYFNLESNNNLEIGTLSDTDISLIQASIGNLANPGLDYRSSLYNTKAIGYHNPQSTDGTLFSQSNNNTNITSITTDRTKNASIKLLSDENSPVGTALALRGWNIQKNGTSGSLSFNYQNTDTLGQIVIPEYSVLNLNGVTNEVEFPSSKIVFGGDTNLYRNSANLLKTDDSLSVGTLTPNRVVITDGSNILASSIVTSSELTYLSGLTSDIQTQLSEKVNKSGDTMSGTLILSTGTTATPSLQFSSNTNTGLSANTNNLSISTNSVERAKVSSAGVFSINNLNTAGVVHNDSFGNLTTSLVTNADIIPGAGITDSKLDTITTTGKVANSSTTGTSSNTPSTLVLRDPSGNFSGNTITANSFVGNVTGSSSLNVLKTGDTMTGGFTLPAGSAANPSLKFTGSTNTGISAPTSNSLSLGTNGIERVNVNSSGNVTISNLSSVGVVHTNASGVLSTSLVVNSDIQNTTITNAKLATVSSANTSGNIVARDGSGNFSTNQITIIGAVSNPSDVATKDYVDSSISSGLVAKTPAVVVSTTNIILSGLQTIDSISLVATDRILLTGQSSPIENGVWEVQVAGWTRPLDFNTGDPAGQSYVLITAGTLNGGSSWLCNTPTAIIGTDPITFAQFSLPNQLTGANVGVGTGQVFRNKTGNNLNFRTLIGGTHMIVTNNADDITFTTDGVATNMVSTLVARDGFGNFSANNITSDLTGAASANVLKSGDSMSGTLNMLNQNEIRFQDSTGGEYVGLIAPSVVPVSYTLSLPGVSPTTGQTLRAGSLTATNLEWITEGGSITPSTSRVIYITKYGNDLTGNGSFDLPYASLSAALSTANAIASAISPVTIFINAGVYTENNSIGALTISSEGISIVGDSMTSVVIMPSTPANNLLIATQTTYISNLTFMSSSPLAIGLSLSVGTFSIVKNVKMINFLIGLNCAGSSSSYLCENSIFISNGTALVIDNTVLECNTNTIIGSSSLYGAAANTGLSISGLVSVCAISGGSFASCITGMDIGSNALLTASAVVFKLNTNDIIQTAASHMTLSACTFAITTSSTDIDIQISGTGTYAEIIGCQFNGKDIASIPGSSAIYVSDGATVDINGGGMKNYTNALRIGAITDTSTTKLLVSSFDIRDCTNDVIQLGTSTFSLTSSTASSTKISINDSTNVKLAFFNLDFNSSLEIGSVSDVNTSLLQVATASSANTGIDYLSNLYTTKGIGVHNPTVNNSSLFALSTGGQSDIISTTTDRAKSTSLNLFSDTGITVGTSTALRGWTIKKNATSSELAFRYRNSDIVGQSSIPEFTLAQMDGVNNQFQLPTSNTQIVFGGDTNLYRSAANQLKTDDSLVIGTLTANRAVITNGSVELASSAVTSTELGYLSGVTSAIQTQLTGKVNKSGDTMTGTLQLIAGTTIAPSLVFTGSTTTGLSATSSNLSFSTSALERLKISSSGSISINQFTTVGIVHNDASGNLSTSLIVNADVSPSAGIVDTKLATISTSGKVSNSATTATSLNTPSTIVARDGSGDFAMGSLTASGNILLVNTTSSTTGVITKGGVQWAHNYGTNNTFTGALSGNFTLTGVRLSGFGVNCLAASTSGNDCSAFGYNALATNDTGAQNTAFGSGALAANTFRNNNTAIGYNVLVTSGTGFENTGVGSLALSGITIGVACTAVGYSALKTGSTLGSSTAFGWRTLELSNSDNNTAMGAYAMGQSVTGSSNAAFGERALEMNSGRENTALGRWALKNNMLANENTAVGAQSLYTNTTGTNNCAVGFSSLYLNDIGLRNTGMGNAVLGNSNTNDNTGFGYAALTNVLGAQNTAIGSLSGQGSIGATGVNNVFMGFNTGPVFTTASQSALIGMQAGLSLTSGNNNTLLGCNAGNSLTIGASNTCIGFGAGSALVATSNNVIIAHSGVLGDSGVIRVGTSGTQVKNFQAGIRGVTPDATDGIPVYISSTGQLCTSGSGGTYTAAAPITAVDSNGIVVGANTLTLEFADGTRPGIVSIAAQTIAGAKTFSSLPILTSFTTVGVVHNNASGVLSTSLIVDADITTGTITDAKLATISTAGKVANSATTATNLNTASAIVARDASGNFTAGTITATLSGTSTNFSGSLVGNVTGTQGATVVSTVGGATAANVASASAAVIAATSLATAGTLVRRSAGGDINVSSLNTVNIGSTGNINTASTTTPTSGAITQNGNRYIHSIGTNCFFAGQLAGNIALSSGANCTGVGFQALSVALAGANQSAFGYNALTLSTGASNSAFGSSCLAANSTGTRNSGFGFETLLTCATANDNTAFGFQALRLATAASNTAFGSLCLDACSTGTQNTAVGSGALGSLSTTTGSTAMGFNALTLNTSASMSAFGMSCLAANTSGVRNSGFGFETLLTCATASDNTAFGFQALRLATAANNTAFGSLCLDACSTGVQNTAVGASALGTLSTANNATAVGYFALALNTAVENTAVGSACLSNCSTGTGNVGLGYFTLNAITTATNSTGVGYGVLSSDTGGSNTALGYGAGNTITTGTNNICIGVTAGSTLTTGSNNIYIGLPANSSSDSSVCKIGSIRGVTSAAADSIAVLISSTGQLCTISSLRSKKENIIDIDEQENHKQLQALQPHRFDFIGSHGKYQTYGLIIDECIEMSPQLIATDANGDPETIFYDRVNIMLLKDHQYLTQKVNEQDNIIKNQEKIIKTLVNDINKIKKMIDGKTY